MEHPSFLLPDRMGGSLEILMDSALVKRNAPILPPFSKILLLKSNADILTFMQLSCVSTFGVVLKQVFLNVFAVPGKYAQYVS